MLSASCYLHSSSLDLDLALSRRLTQADDLEVLQKWGVQPQRGPHEDGWHAVGRGEAGQRQRRQAAHVHQGPAPLSPRRHPNPNPNPNPNPSRPSVRLSIARR